MSFLSRWFGSSGHRGRPIPNAESLRKIFFGKILDVEESGEVHGWIMVDDEGALPENREFRYPLGGFPYTLKGRGPLPLPGNNLRFYVRVAEWWALLDAMPDTTVTLEAKVSGDVLLGRALAVGKVITVLGTKQAFCHPSQLSLRGMVYLAAMAASSVQRLSGASSVKEAIEVGFRFAAGEDMDVKEAQFLHGRCLASERRAMDKAGTAAAAAKAASAAGWVAEAAILAAQLVAEAGTTADELMEHANVVQTKIIQGWAGNPPSYLPKTARPWHWAGVTPHAVKDAMDEAALATVAEAGEKATGGMTTSLESAYYLAAPYVDDMEEASEAALKYQYELGCLLLQEGHTAEKGLGSPIKEARLKTRR